MARVIAYSVLVWCTIMLLVFIQYGGGGSTNSHQQQTGPRTPPVAWRDVEVYGPPAPNDPPKGGFCGTCVMLAGAAIPPVLSNATPDLKQAYLDIATADFFAVGPIGEGATIPPAVIGFSMILNDEANGEVFSFLVDHGKPVAQLYGLCGLWLIDQDAYKAAEAVVLKNGTAVEEMSGCLVFSKSTAEIIAFPMPPNVRMQQPPDIRNGGYPEVLLNQSLVPLIPHHLR